MTNGNNAIPAFRPRPAAAPATPGRAATTSGNALRPPGPP
jgi:hypothetical protein